MPGRTDLSSVHIYLPAELLGAIDRRVRRQDDMSRNRWIVRALAKAAGRPDLADQLRAPGRPKGKKNGRK